LYFSSLIEDLFNTKDKAEAFAMLEQAGPFLRSLEGARLQGGPAQNTFGSLFEVEQVTKVEEIDLANPDDDALRGLEESVFDN
jgi:hypothetical protein